GVIIAQRHVHLGKELAQELDLENDEVVIAYKDNKKLFDAVIKVKNPSYEELHIDIEESNIYNLEHGEEVEIYKCGK
ncbi:MAG: PduL/EutD family phosphate acyltransferase, partial [Bacilli bacterium]